MSQSSPKNCYTTVRIDGMTCASCELLLERKLKAVPGIQAIDISHRTGIARITADADHLPNEETIAAVIEKAGYTMLDGNAAFSPNQRKWMEIGASFLIIFALYKVLQVFDIVSLAPSTSGVLSIGGIFLIGLVAGTSSCLAVTGGLLVALAAKHNETNKSETAWKKFKPLLHFNIGRLASYFVLGGLVGLLGQSITLSTRMTGYMNILVALVMLYLALTILNIVPKGSFPIRPPKKLSRWIANLSESNDPRTPFLFGALTFFLPCGFTQSLQLVALASGNFATGAVVMFVFALGTLPALLGISAISSSVKGKVSHLFLRFSGALVLLLALFNLQTGFALAGFDVGSSAPVINQPAPAVAGGIQEVSTRVGPGYYEPNNLVIKAGVPVRWKIDGSGAVGCTSIMTIPSLNITKPLVSGENTIEFTAPNKGKLAFMCSMGMVRGSFTVI